MREIRTNQVGVVVEKGFRRLAAVRQAAAVHPHGLTFDAELVSEHPLPDGRFEAIARLTKGGGTPDGRADVLGLAIRLRPGADDRPWDLLFSSAGEGRLSRWIPRPARDWGKARYGSLSPYEVDGRQFWLQAVPQTPVGHASVAELEQTAPEQFVLMISGRSAEWVPIGRLILFGPVSDSQDRLDPVGNCPPGWRLKPTWLRNLRARAYRGSRQGRTD